MAHNPEVEGSKSLGQKVIRKACDNFLHYELNLNRALPVKHEDRQVPGPGPPPLPTPPTLVPWPKLLPPWASAFVRARRAAVLMSWVLGWSWRRRRLRSYTTA